MSEPHTPSYEDMEIEYGLDKQFRWWLQARESRIEAAAEQRGAIKAFDDTVKEIAQMEGNRRIIARYLHLNPYRADQIEDDDGT